MNGMRSGWFVTGLALRRLRRRDSGALVTALGLAVATIVLAGVVAVVTIATDRATADALPERAPRFAQPDGRVKTSAAWLIEQAGFGRGFGGRRHRLRRRRPGRRRPELSRGRHRLGCWRPGR